MIGGGAMWSKPHPQPLQKRRGKVLLQFLQPAPTCLLTPESLGAERMQCVLLRQAKLVPPNQPLIFPVLSAWRALSLHHHSGWLLSTIQVSTQMSPP